MESLICKHWHHCPADEVTTLLTTNASKGLSQFEAKHRLERSAPTVSRPKSKKGR